MSTKNEALKNDILQMLHEATDGPLTAAEMANALKLRGAARKRLQKWLAAMVKQGDIVCLRGNRYALGQKAGLATGRLDVARSGNGYVTGADCPQGVFVRQDDLSTALPGDRVVVRLHTEPPRGRKGKPASAGAKERAAGKIIRILERGRHDIVGTVRLTGRLVYVIPINPVYRQSFAVPDAKGATPGHRVVVRFVQWASKHVSPEGEILEVLGPEDDPSVDTLAMMRHYGLSGAFEQSVVREAESVSALMDEPGEREDLREQYLLTVDPARARDFDDALSLDRDADDRPVLGIHIADVSHFVREGSALDIEARARGCSVYFPDQVIPMLPEQLSNGVCSLRPDEDRLAFSVFLTLGKHGEVLSRRFAKTLIRSALRLTYEQAMDCLDGKNVKGVPQKARRLLADLDRAAQRFRAQRIRKHALDLDIPECEIVMGDDGMISGIRLVPYDASHKLVEECMVAANEAVAAELAGRGIHIISRLHPPPSYSRIEDLTAELLSLGYTPGDLSKPRNLARFLRSIRDNPLAHHVRISVLRSMKRATYSAEDTGHYGLAKKYYAHFTSPIRRYPDLVLHRQLATALATGRRGQPDQDALKETALACTDREQNAEEAERAVVEIKKYRYLQQQLELQSPATYEATVVNVSNFGLFVELMELQVQGLVHVSAISDRFVRYSRKTQSLRAGRKRYSLGQKVRVYVTDVNFDKRQVDFALA
jgi:ribonuclease R